MNKTKNQNKKRKTKKIDIAIRIESQLLKQKYDFWVGTLVEKDPKISKNKALNDLLLKSIEKETNNDFFEMISEEVKNALKEVVNEKMLAFFNYSKFFFIEILKKQEALSIRQNYLNNQLAANFEIDIKKEAYRFFDEPGWMGDYFKNKLNKFLMGLYDANFKQFQKPFNNEIPKKSKLEK